MKTYRLQPKGKADGTLPYPYFIGANSYVGRQDFWQGDPYQLLGFSEKPITGEMEISFEEFKKNPNIAIGKYPVFCTVQDTWKTLLDPIESVEVRR